jgi:hypothetical protein
MDKVVRQLIALVYQGILAVNDFDVGRMLVERRHIGVVFPQRGAGRARVCQKLAGIAKVQIPNRGCQHDDVARGEQIAKYEPSHEVAIHESW